MRSRRIERGLVNTLTIVCRRGGRPPSIWMLDDAILCSVPLLMALGRPAWRFEQGDPQMKVSGANSLYQAHSIMCGGHSSNSSIRSECWSAMNLTCISCAKNMWDQNKTTRGVINRWWLRYYPGNILDMAYHVLWLFLSFLSINNIFVYSITYSIYFIFNMFFNISYNLPIIFIYHNWWMMPIPYKLLISLFPIYVQWITWVSSTAFIFLGFFVVVVLKLNNLK